MRFYKEVSDQRMAFVFFSLFLSSQIGFARANADDLIYANAPREAESANVPVTPPYFPFRFMGWPATFAAQLGGFIAKEGSNQHVNIDGLVGDEYSVTNGSNGNAMVGLAYFLQGPRTFYGNIGYGVNAFYLAPVRVEGTITQENLFTNLSYKYHVTNWPIFFGAKGNLYRPYHDRYHLTFDLGIGPNVIQTTNFEETPIGEVREPNFHYSPTTDTSFSGRTTVAFAAQAGIGFKFNRAFGPGGLECGYRFFYLGQGKFNRLNDQYLDNITTGQSYANAVLCALTI